MRITFVYLKRGRLFYCTNRSMIVVPEAVYQREISTKRGVQKTDCYNYNSQQNFRLKWHHSSLHNEWSLQLHTVNPVLNCSSSQLVLPISSVQTENTFSSNCRLIHIEVSGYNLQVMSFRFMMFWFIHVLYYDELITKVSGYRMLKEGIINTRKVETKYVLVFSYCDKRWNSANSFW